MSYEPGFRERLDRLRVLTVEQGHTRDCAMKMAYSNATCSCGKNLGETQKSETSVCTYPGCGERVSGFPCSRHGLGWLSGWAAR